MNISNILLWTGACCMCFLCGMFLGEWEQDRSEMLSSVVVEKETEYVPMVAISKIENGELFLSHKEQEVRFTLPNGDIFISHEGNTQIPVLDILPMLKMLPAPEGSLFVASKRGTKYWPLDSPQAFLLSPKNRVFYRSREEAESDGKGAGVE